MTSIRLSEYDLDTSHTVNSVHAPTNADLRLLHADETNLRIQEVLNHALADPEYQQLKQFIMNGFPATKGALSDRLKKYWKMHCHLSVDDDFIVFRCRLFVPESLQPEMLSRLHEGHQGINTSQNRACLTLYWPSIDQDIHDMIDNCQHCQDRLPSNPQEPIQSEPRPTRPFQHVAADFAQYRGNQFLITVDCFTHGQKFPSWVKTQPREPLWKKLAPSFAVPLHQTSFGLTKDHSSWPTSSRNFSKTGESS